MTGCGALASTLPPRRLYLGGDVGGDSVNLLHGICGLRDSLEVVSGVHVRGAGLWAGGSVQFAGAALLLLLCWCRGRRGLPSWPSMKASPSRCGPLHHDYEPPASPSSSPPQLGGFLEAKRGLEEGRFSADQFKVLTRYCGGWGAAFDTRRLLQGAFPFGAAHGCGDGVPSGLVPVPVAGTHTRGSHTSPARRKTSSVRRARSVALPPLHSAPPPFPDVPAGWGPGQLEMECARGVWMPVSASKAAILAQPPPTRGSKASVADLWHHIAQVSRRAAVAVRTSTQSSSVLCGSLLATPLPLLLQLAAGCV